MVDLIKVRQKLDEIDALSSLVQGDTDVVLSLGKAITEMRQALV